MDSQCAMLKGPALLHCAGAQLLVAFADGTLSGCSVLGKTLTSVWNVPLGARCFRKHG